MEMIPLPVMKAAAVFMASKKQNPDLAGVCIRHEHKNGSTLEWDTTTVEATNGQSLIRIEYQTVDQESCYNKIASYPEETVKMYIRTKGYSELIPGESSWPDTDSVMPETEDMTSEIFGMRPLYLEHCVKACKALKFKDGLAFSMKNSTAPAQAKFETELEGITYQVTILLMPCRLD